MPFDAIEEILETQISDIENQSVDRWIAIGGALGSFIVGLAIMRVITLRSVWKNRVK
jgi:hypothetical protein